MLGFGDEAGAHRSGEVRIGLDQATRIEIAVDRRVNGRVRVERAQARGQALDRLRRGEVGLRHDQSIGEDDLLSCLYRPCERIEAASASTTATTTSTWNSPPSARSVANVCR